MTYGSLFSGIGGLDLGLDRAKFTCKWQVENDPYAIKVLQKHWPHVKRYGDITTVRGDELEPVDLICGGFPCQDLSQAGKRIGIKGTRSGLWFEYARLVGELRPRYVLIENVPGLLVYDGMRRVIGELARLGYVGAWRSLRASEFGASHLRKRVFIVAYRDAVGNSPGGQREQRRRPLQNQRDLPGPDGRCDPLVPDSGSTRLPDSEQTGLRRPGRWNEGRTTPELRGAPLPQFAPGPSDPRWPIILRERPDLAPALASFRGVADGLSDWMDGAMSNRTKRLGRLGNAVVPQIAEWIGHRIQAFNDAND